MRCKGICYRFAAKKPSDGYRFAAGQRPCSICGIFVDVNLYSIYRCPCCNNKLRLASRNTRSRKNRFNRLYNSAIFAKTNDLMKSISKAIGNTSPVVPLPRLK